MQKRFTKQLHGMRDNNNKNLPYDKRLQKLGALSLEKRRLYVDLVYTYIALHKLIDYAPFGFGLSLQKFVY